VRTRLLRWLLGVCDWLDSRKDFDFYMSWVLFIAVVVLAALLVWRW
jgi:hypothetical protein